MDAPSVVHQNSNIADFLSARDKIILELMYGAGLEFRSGWSKPRAS